MNAREPWESGPPPHLFDNDAPDPEPPPGISDEERTQKLADRIVQIVDSSAELFHEKEIAFAAVPLEKRRAIFKLKSHSMRSWIARTARNVLGKSVGSAAIEEAIVTLDGVARFDREEQRVHLRVAEHGGGLYIDLGDETGACIEVTKQRWRVRNEAPVMFRRPAAMRALPRPIAGGSISELRPFFNAADDDALFLFVAWMVAAFRPGRPYPILALHGEQGTAKSTASRVARMLVDPNAAPVRTVTRNEDDLAVATIHSHVVAFDNLSGVAPWLSDALCRLATGGGLSKRTLYTDDDETIIDAIRPIIVNGIDEIANRADLAERCLVLTLRRIEKGKRKDEASFWRAFDAAAPRILGVLLDGIVSALRELPRVQIDELPRMADFAKWTTAAERGLKLAPGTLLAAYARNRASVIDVALDASPVATAVRRLLEDPKCGGRWKGEPADLLAALGALSTDETKRAPGWPKNAGALSNRLRRSATFLRSIGIDLDLDGHEGRGDDKHRIWIVSKGAGSQDGVPSDPASPRPEKIEDGADRDPNSARPQPRPHESARGRGDDPGTSGSTTAATLEPGENSHGERGDDGDDDSQSMPTGGCFADLIGGDE